MMTGNFWSEVNNTRLNCGISPVGMHERHLAPPRPKMLVVALLYQPRAGFLQAEEAVEIPETHHNVLSFETLTSKTPCGHAVKERPFLIELFL